MADRALLDACTATNPVKPTKEDVKRILTEIYWYISKDSSLINEESFLFVNSLII